MAYQVDSNGTGGLWVRSDGYDRDHVLLGAVVPEDPPRRGRLVLHVGVPYFLVLAALQRFVLMRVEPWISRIVLKQAESPPDFLQLLLVLRRLLKVGQDGGRLPREPKFVRQDLIELCVVGGFCVLGEVPEVHGVARSAFF
jgi:hypothetical protein